MPDIAVPLCMPVVPFKLLPQCWRSEGVSLCKFMCGFSKKNYLGLQKFPHWFNSCWSLQSEVMGTYLPGTGTLSWRRSGVGLGLLAPEMVLLNFYPQHVDVATVHSASPPLLQSDGCGFFNSIVVRIPFKCISDSSEWWVFCNLVVIFMWLCEKASHIYLCQHLPLYFLNYSPLIF